MKKRIKGKMTISRPVCGGSGSKVCIDIQDSTSKIHFVEIEVDLAEFTNAITGLGSRPVEMEVMGLDRVGMERETMEIEFPIGEDYRAREHAAEIAKDHTPEGWVPPSYFSSQNSFFRKHDKQWARGLACRFVEPKNGAE